ncbi:MAG: hypothetical protein EAZ35_02240 [Sphingobacteriia bacterium]|nr:MAG: hypothetical protein EAZ35_02240 [Sphingobacteriia bacterium]
MDNSKWDKLRASYDVNCQKIITTASVDKSESHEQRVKRMSLLEKDYIKWFEYYFPRYAKVKCAWFHKKMSKIIIANKKIKFFGEVYRSGAKSVHGCLGIPMFLYLVKKDISFMVLFGETKPKAAKLLSDIQAELQFNNRIKNDYGLKFKQGDWADGDFFTTDAVRFMSLGFDQSARGLREGSERPDYIVIDDVDSKTHVNNDRIMSDSVDKILEEIVGCFDASDDSTERFVYTNNNFHKNSITNRLKAEFEKSIKIDLQNDEATQYYILSVPAVKDIIDFIPNWPEKTSSEYWKRKYQKRPRAFLREFMNIHVQEGKIFKAENMQHKQMLPLKEYDALIFIGDLSYKDKGDYKGMFLIGKINRELHIIHSFLRQTNRPEVARYVYDVYERRKLSSKNIRYVIDGLFAQDEFISDFDREGDERGYWIPVLADKKSNGNKYDHIESVEGHFLRRWVWWNIEEKDYPDQVEAIDQFLAFEKGSRSNDDGPDAIAKGFKELEIATFTEKFEPAFSKRNASSKNRY